MGAEVIGADLTRTERNGKRVEVKRHDPNRTEHNMNTIFKESTNVQNTM